eukprot:51553_1
MKPSVSTESPREQSEFKYNNYKQFKYTSNDIITKSTLQQIGFDRSTKITDTLQGSIYRASNSQNNVVCKITNINLHNESAALVDGKIFKCNENIQLESSILKYLTQHKDCPPSIVKFISFSQSATDYIMIMENGGSALFDFITKSHNLIQSGKIEISHWKKVCKLIFSQMVECIDYIHSKNVCHFDISLENFLIND